MPFDTYANLQTSVLSFAGRPGDANIPVTDLIAIFETDAGRRLRTHYQETSTTITTVAGTASYAFPADLLAVRELTITSTTPSRTLIYMGSGELDDSWAFTNSTQEPANYTIEGTNIRLGPVPDTAYTLRLEYWQDIPSLSNSTTTNWLLTNHPDLYLYGVLAELELFLGADSSDDRYQLFINRREAGYQALQRQDRRYRSGGTPLAIARSIRGP